MDAEQRCQEALRELGLSPGVSFAEVRAARNTLIKVWHPDRFVGDESLRAEAEAKLARVNVAFDWINKNRDVLSRMSAGPDQSRTGGSGSNSAAANERTQQNAHATTGPTTTKTKPPKGRDGPSPGPLALILFLMLAVMTCVALNTEDDSRARRKRVADYPGASLGDRPFGPSRPEAARAQEYFVVASSLNIRARPSLSAEVVGGLKQGDRVFAVERVGEWLGLRAIGPVADSVYGWISSKYVSKNRPRTDSRNTAGTTVRPKPSIKIVSIRRPYERISPADHEIVVSNFGNTEVSSVTIGFSNERTGKCSRDLKRYDGVKKFDVRLRPGDSTTLTGKLGSRARGYCIADFDSARRAESERRRNRAIDIKIVEIGRPYARIDPTEFELIVSNVGHAPIDDFVIGAKAKSSGSCSQSFDDYASVDRFFGRMEPGDSRAVRGKFRSDSESFCVVVAE